MKLPGFTRRLKRRAGELGFRLTGVCPAVSPQGLSRFHDWLAAGYAGEMRYLIDRKAAYTHPRSVLDGVRSILMLGMNYRSGESVPAEQPGGRVSCYAWGTIDYHDLIHGRLKELVSWYRQQDPGARLRGVVDTAPLLEREFAQLAGLGWVGKHTLLLNRQQGSWFFLAALLSDQLLEYDTPYESDYCGSCRACLDACPTAAFPEPYVLDATRCISYLTIELQDSVPVDLRDGLDNWVFGCDVCQEVCPWNRAAPPAQETQFAADSQQHPLDVVRLFDLDEAAFRQRFRKTPLWRSKRRGLLRNAAIVLGNRPSERGLNALLRGLHDQEMIVRAAAAWALGRHQQVAAADALRARLAEEAEPAVRAEIQSSLGR
ncbi:MAG: tRNA epoxyqueuosine(34) reductase QueG [Planctomycetota bacterium]|nr:tRNA epoxyqueuosine(34) reductase QueG [Planctomycetota bacterium]